MSTQLTPGSAAPEFDLATDGGGRVRLSDLGGGPAIVYFYPRDDTSGCTRQAIAFSGLRPRFDAIGARIVGISADSPARHDAFKNKHGLTIQLASDADGSVLEAYGVWVEKSMYGRRYMGIERSTFLIDASGTIARVWRKVRVRGHAEEVLEAARRIRAG
jgi:peroxiredoxin Q/BCP